MNNLPKVVAQQRRGRASNPRLLDCKSDALPLSHHAYCTAVPNFFNYRVRPRTLLEDVLCDKTGTICQSVSASLNVKKLKVIDGFL